MRWRLILAGVLLIPLIEIAVFVAVGETVGYGWTLLAMLATSVLGFAVVRTESRRSFERVREAMQTGDVRASGASDGGLRLAGGFAMLMPGFVTDLAGLVLLIPPVRRVIRTLLLQRFVAQVSPEMATVMFGPRRVRARRGRAHSTAGWAGGGGPVIDGEVIEGQVIDGDVIDGGLDDRRR